MISSFRDYYAYARETGRGRIRSALFTLAETTFDRCDACFAVWWWFLKTSGRV